MRSSTGAVAALSLACVLSLSGCSDDAPSGDKPGGKGSKGSTSTSASPPARPVAVALAVADPEKVRPVPGALTQLTVTNTGTKPAQYVLLIAPTGPYAVEPARVDLQPGKSTTVAVRGVPDPEGTEVTVRAISESTGTEIGSLDLTLERPTS